MLLSAELIIDFKNLSGSPTCDQLCKQAFADGLVMLKH